ncbi:MAG: glycosyltransferase [Acidobacteriota bacterium]|nr:glycosyltransferase [Acidobacteriota bacterium]MDH3528563.1 glycosyltransferase [Acidobacteriota bacterium]
MNILYTLDSLNRGGAETFVLDLCRNAGRFGITPVFAAFGGGTLEDDFRAGGFEFIKIERRAPLDPRLVIRLRKLIREFNIDIIHTSQPVEALHAYFAAFLTRTKCIQSHQGVYSEKRNKIAARFITPLVDANITVSESLRIWLENELRVDTSKRFYLAYNSVEPSRLAPTGNDVRDELGIAKEALVIGNVGNFMVSGRKEQLTICRAFSKLPADERKLALIFAGKARLGEQDYLERCKAFCADAGIADLVFFLGERDDIPDVLKALDIFVFASVAEGLPIALIEAMLAGLPVVASDIPQNLEVTNQGQTARIFPVGDPDSLAGAIHELANDPVAREKTAAAGRDFALKKFTMESHFETLLGIYREVMGSKREFTNDIAT